MWLEIPETCVSSQADTSLLKLTAQPNYTNYTQTLFALCLFLFFLQEFCFILGLQTLAEGGGSGLCVPYLHTWVTQLSQHSCPGSCTFLTKAPKLLLLMVYTFAIWEDQQTETPFPWLLMRFPNDSVKLNPGSLNSHNYHGIHQPRIGLCRGADSLLLILNRSLIGEQTAAPLPQALARPE